MVNYTITKGSMGDKPKITKPDPKFLEQLGEEKFWKMINHFYELVTSGDIAYFFPQDEKIIEMIKKRNGAYFIQMCGGDDTYIANGGTFDQVKVHQEFSISQKARIEWLGTWQEVLMVYQDNVDHKYIQSYWDWLDKFSIHMINFELDKKDEIGLTKV
ncbi:putative globin [hydrothermal vent metagenome]|uniref:Putative globin n=1 Tax=hydrothermal vent metagenome TaxID=652676 RepID=A0A3B1E722_9ZZZZ